MSIYLRLLLLAVVVIFVVDISGVIDSIKAGLEKWLAKELNGRRVGSLRPFSCSLCMVHHTCVIYAICVGEFSLLIWAYICVLAAFSKEMGAILTFARYALETAISIANALCDAWWDLLHKNKI